MRASTSIVLLPLVVATLLGCSSDSGALPNGEARELVENRNWLDRWPTSADDRLHVYRFTPDMGGGVYQDRTLFAGRFELFTYKLADGVVGITWPDRAPNGGVVEEVHYRIEAVDGPKPFDLRMTLRGTGLGPKVFYGIRAETGSRAELEARLEALARSLTD